MYKTTQESVITMLYLEEQAKMNWYAYCGAGPDHPRIPDELIDEMTNRPRVQELPHFKTAMTEETRPLTGGVWEYYTWKVSRDL